MPGAGFIAAAFAAASMTAPAMFIWLRHVLSAIVPDSGLWSE